MRFRVLPWLVLAILTLQFLPASAQEGADATERPPPYKAEEPHTLPRHAVAPGEPPAAEDYWLEEGYQLRLVSGEMTYPTALAMGPAGELYVIEAGYSYGSATAIPRIMRVQDDGRTEEVARLPDGPVTGLVHHEGFLYAVGGRDPAEVWRVDPASGNLTTVLTGFPVWGHHFTSQLVFGPDDKLYFAVGYPSNSGVIGEEDFYQFQYLSIFPLARDIPCVRHVLAGHNFKTSNPFTDDPDDRAFTGAFHRFGEQSQPGEVIEPTPPPGCNGALFRANADGSGLEVFATGFRNPFGINFDNEGRLFLIDQGMDNGGSRPIANDLDPMWEVTQGGWYGFPDYPSGFPVTLPGFHGHEKAKPEPLLLEHPPLAGRPVFLFVPSCGCMQFDFGRGEAFGYKDHAFIAEYGSQFHNDDPRGFRVERLDMKTKTVGDFYINLVPGPNGTSPERPISVEFSQNGETLYLLDFGDFSTDSSIFYSSPLTGGLWRIDRVGTAVAGSDASGAKDYRTVSIAGAAAVVGILLLSAMALRDRRLR